MQAGIPDPGFYDQTTLHPVGLGLVAVLAFAMQVVPRRWAILPLAIIACFIAPAQRVVVVGLDFTLLRIVIASGWLRLICRGELHRLELNRMDALLILWCLWGTLAYTLLHSTPDAFVYRLGTSFDAVAGYFLFRFLLRNREDVEHVLLVFIAVSVPVVASFIVEKMTSRNLFAAFGGVPAFTAIRQGKLRCQGAFAHPILAGCFWASLAPMFAALFALGPPWRHRAIIGALASLLLVLLCASSTPVISALCAALGLVLFRLRRIMPWIVWGAFGTIVGLHLYMKAPVWHLLGRIDVVGGSTGYHRYRLINQAVHRFDEWWLFGVRSTDHWGSGLFDVTNQYVAEAVNGGLLNLVLFVAMLAVAFRMVGRLWRAPGQDLARAFFLWSLGVALFVHCVSFVAISYFGQIILLWHMLLAMISSLHERFGHREGLLTHTVRPTQSRTSWAT